MSGVSITAGPTLVNPEALNSVSELRKALHDANTHLFNLALERCRLLGALDDFGGVMEELVVANMNGDDDAVKARLDRIQKNLVLVGGSPRAAH